MKILLALIIFIDIALASLASTMIYNISLSADGYVTDVTALEAPGYFRVNLQGDLPENILCGCYRLVDGAFVLDQMKYDAWLASQQTVASQTVASSSM